MTRVRRSVIEWLVLAAALLLAGGGLVYFQEFEHRRITAEEELRLQYQAEIIEKNLIPRIFSVNRALEGVLEDFHSSAHGDKRGYLSSRRLQLISDTLVGVRNITVVNAKGIVLSSNKEELIGRDLSARPYFQNARNNLIPKTLSVSAPFKTIFNLFSIALVRNITGSKGEFSGIVIASVDPEYFDALLESVRYAPDVRSFLLHGDGQLFMVSPEIKALHGKNLLLKGSLLSQFVDSGQSSRTFSGLSILTNEMRMIAFRSVQPSFLVMDKPLIVVVSRDLPAIFQHWRDEYVTGGWMLGLLALVASVILFTIQRRQRLFAALSERLEYERNTAEKLLRSSRDMLHSIVENVPLRVFWKDRDSHFLGCNTSFAQDAELAAPVDLIGKNDFEMVWKSNAENFRADDRAVMESNTPRLDIEEQQTGLNEKSSWINTSKVPLRDENDQVIGVLGIYSDITEKKKTDELLRVSEENLRQLNAELELRVGSRTSQLADANLALDGQQQFIRTITDAIPSLIGYWDTDLRCRFSNSAYLEWFGKNTEEMQGIEMV